MVVALYLSPKPRTKIFPVPSCLVIPVVFVTAAATSLTVHAFGTQGYTAAVGPFQIATNQTFIFPAAAYGWTAGNTGIRAYELF